MKTKTRHQRSSETSQRQSAAATASVSEEKKTPGNRGRPRKAVVPDASDAFHRDNGATDENDKLPQTKSPGRLSTAVCRLCHGKFSPRSLRHAFDRRSRDSVDRIDEERDATAAAAAAPSPLLFHTDFQRLVGVELNRDPRLSEFICKKCHAKFYKCQNILIRFLQRVNLPAAAKENGKSRKNTKTPESSVNHGSITSPAFTSDSECLHSLVSWAHRHAEACGSCPGLREVLEGQCWGTVKAVWACVDGHRYIMDTQCTAATAAPPRTTTNLRGGASVGGDGVMSDVEEVEQQRQEEEDDNEEEVHCGLTGSSNSVTGQTRRSTVDEWTSNTAGLEDTSPAETRPEDRTADSHLSVRVVSVDEFEDNGRGGLSDDELFEPRVDKRSRRVNVPNKRRRPTKTSAEPKIKKKPGPKPGGKNQFNPKGEELPNIYKCPHQGCTAVYRASDALKKHIKELHEDVRERACPHPGCNKVFMIDRYLQRHVKLIHTEERNYICDQCGQTFKQRKHLSVHQMRHSGVKPLQCEVCGFQCRQRASLKYHMTKHKAEADLEFACLLCGKRFEKAHNLNVHMSMVHPVIQTEAQRGGGRQQQQQQQQPSLPPPPPPPPPYSELQTITMTGEVVQHEQDR